MFQQEIDDAVRRATSGRWTIRARSPRSAIAIQTHDAASLKAEVQRLQFTEHYQILAIEAAGGQDGIMRAAMRLGQAQKRIIDLGGRAAKDGQLASILNDLEDALTEAQMEKDELLKQLLPAAGA